MIQILPEGSLLPPISGLQKCFIFFPSGEPGDGELRRGAGDGRQRRGELCGPGAAAKQSKKRATKRAKAGGSLRDTLRPTKGNPHMPAALEGAKPCT